MSKKTVATRDRETPAQNVPEQGQTSVAVSAGGAAAQNTLRNIRLIIGREYKNRVTQRSFIITSVILLVLVFLAAFIPTIGQLIKAGPTSPTSQTHIVVVNDAGSVAGLTDTQLAATIGTTLNGTTGTQTAGPPAFALSFSPSHALADLQQQVKSGQLDILLVLDRAPNQDMRFTYYTTNSSTNDPNLSTVQALTQELIFLDTAHRLGLTSQETQHLGAAPDLIVVQTQHSQATRSQSESAAGFVLAFAGVILIFISIQIYAGIVATGVAEEKSSRMMELLLNAATPFQLLAGKIVGIGAACLTQMGCLVVVGIGALLLQTPLQSALFGTHAGSFSQYLTGVSIPFYLLFLLYFLLAFFLYATIYAGLASLVKRQEEVQSVIMLPILLLSSGYVLFFFVVATPDATVTKVLSYLPFWTPILMLMRLALDTVAWWEIVVTVALMLLTILACVWFAARLYRYGVLMYGQRPGLGQLLKLVRMN
ncbi:MAG TPA: ABC transporter permease [Ktedonobacteraceae bacterium]|nr:ABC transporter permease [Ktedonobacteraceae bacterium]